MDITTLNIALGSVACLGSVFGIIGFIRSCRKPKAYLRFAGGNKEIAVTPYYVKKKSLKYYIPPTSSVRDYKRYDDLLRTIDDELNTHNQFLLKFRLSNIGKLQLENYRVEVELKRDNQSRPTAHYVHHWVIGNFIEPPEEDYITLDRNQTKVTYSPKIQKPLNQKDSEEFEYHFTPVMNVPKVDINWRIIAKDFSGSGRLRIKVKPYILEYDAIKLVYRDEDIPADAEKIEDLAPVIKHLEDIQNFINPPSVLTSLQSQMQKSVKELEKVL